MYKRQEKALKGVEGVLSANVNLATEKATVTYIPGVADMADFKRAVADVGYEVVEAPEAVPTEGEKVDEAELKMREARFRMRVAWAFTAPIILWMFAEMFFGILWPNATVYNLGMVVLALPVLFWVGRKTYAGAWAAVRHGYANMDTPVSYTHLTLPTKA